jgi:cell division protein FtsX
MPSFLGPDCAIEIEIDRSASLAEAAAFKKRLETTAHVKRVEVIPRERFIELFKRALRDEGYQGEEYERLAKRAETYAGPTLIATPDDNRNVPQIIVALQDLPAAVNSVFDRPSCE